MDLSSDCLGQSPLGRRNYTAHTHVLTSLPCPNASDNTGLFVLESAANEAQALQRRIPHLHVRVSLCKDEHMRQVQEAINAAETLLDATNITSTLTDLIRSNSNQQQQQVASLHRAFLTVTEWSAGLVSSSSHHSLSEHPLLDSLLRLTVRAHQLDLPFHLPLYQKLANAVAQQPSNIHSQSKWILQIAHWARGQIGSLPPDFFDASILTLTKRQKSKDVVTLLQAMNKNPNMMKPLDQNTTKQILLNLKGGIRSMWNKKGTNMSLLEEDCREIVCLLEESIWNLVDPCNDLDADDKMNMNYGPREIIEDVIFSSEEDLDMEELMFLQDAYNEWQAQHEEKGAMRRPTPLLTEEEEFDMLYTRSLDRKDGLPDITFQITKHSKQETLRYSQEMEREIYSEFCACSEDFS